jgi:hypothetical protein
VRTSLFKFLELSGGIIHGYEVHGLQNIPKEGPALIIFYHTALPYDMNLLEATSFLHRRRIVHVITERALFKIPGFTLMLNVLKAFPGNETECTQKLLDGTVVAISPGGTREAIFSSPDTYNIIWGRCRAVSILNFHSNNRLFKFILIFVKRKTSRVC